MTTTSKKITAKEIKGTARTYGQRLGFLIASLNINNDLKEDLLTLLPYMTLAQIERFSELLQTTYINEQTSLADKRLIVELEKIKLGNDKAQSKLAGQTTTTLANLEQKLANVNKPS